MESRDLALEVWFTGPSYVDLHRHVNGGQPLRKVNLLNPPINWDELCHSELLNYSGSCIFWFSKRNIQPDRGWKSCCCTLGHTPMTPSHMSSCHFTDGFILCPQHVELLGYTSKPKGFAKQDCWEFLLKATDRQEICKRKQAFDD